MNERIVDQRMELSRPEFPRNLQTAFTRVSKTQLAFVSLFDFTGWPKKVSHCQESSLNRLYTNCVEPPQVYRVALKKTNFYRIIN